jgi:mono/diheme cytochrome c family protein
VHRGLAALAALAAAGLVAAGCGSEGIPEAGNTSRGKELFTGEGRCGSCHTLADAGSRGQVGPDLDAAFVQPRRDGLGEETIASVVRNQIAYPVVDPTTGAPGMPANLVTGQDADDVALYVASVAGKAVPPPTGGPPPGGATTGGATTGDGGGEQSGEAIFASAGCGSCHTLAAAGTNGTIGPNLDEAKPSKELAIERVTNGMGAMPSFKGQLSEAEIDAVATYVADAAGQ